MKSFFNAQKTMITEIYQNRAIIYPLARVSIIKSNIESTLGQWWVLIRDMMYYFAFSFFMVLVYGGASDMDGMEKMVFMACGMVPFFIFTEVMGSGMNCIKKNKTIITKMKFPVLIVPVFEGVAIMLSRTLSVIGMLFIVYWFEQFANTEWLAFAYYFICTFALCISLNLLLSALGTISKDFREVILSILRIFIYFVPIMWPMSMVSSSNGNIELIVKLNPMVYVMEGMRSSLSVGVGNTVAYGVYFWIITISIFLVGSYLQCKLRKFYPDVL